MTSPVTARRRSPAAIEQQRVPSRPPSTFVALAVIVVCASLVIRFALLGRQSYWIDELFSVSEVDRSWRAMAGVASTEVHTPLYASLLWIWTRLGSALGLSGTGEAWTRCLSLLAGVLSVPVAHRGLRGTGLSGHVRWALTVATATAGAGLVYSLETRSYALLILGAVGLTATTVRAALLLLRGEYPPRGVLLAWTGWSVLAATVHLFGAVLTLSALAVLGVATMAGTRSGRARHVFGWVLLAAVGCSLQAAWLLGGVGRPGFAAGTSWIHSPGRRDLVDLVTTTFAAGGLTAHADGFAWTSPVGLVAAAALLAGAAGAGGVVRRRGRRRQRVQPDVVGGAPDVVGGAPDAVGGAPDAVGGAPDVVGGAPAEARAAAVLLALAAVTIVAMFVVSHWVRLWTLRNMVVVTPALVWGVICLAAAVAPATARRWVATAAVGLLGLGLVPIAAGLADPYKTDFRGLFAYLAAVRHGDPTATFVFAGHGPPLGWGPVSGPLVAVAGPAAGLRTVASSGAVVRTPGPEVVVVYRGVADRHPERAAAHLAARLGAGSCHPVPLHGLAVVRCG